MLPTICKSLGLPIPETDDSKRGRMTASFNALPDAGLPNTARQFLTHYKPKAVTRNLIEDILWSESACPEIPKRFRREVARAIAPEELFGDARRFDELLDRLWVVEADSLAAIFGRVDTGLKAEIQQHVHRNPGDWSVELLFDRLGAYESPDRRFAIFLEGFASADVRPDETAQRDFVACVNVPLRNCGVELRETAIEGGYPVFMIVSLRGAVRGRPKNLIFASPEKPDLRFRDALDNDIEIVTNANNVLVFDRPIGVDGLLWSDLQLWWSESEGIEDSDVAKRSLYSRLRKSLPSSSPPQTLLFDAFFEGFRTAVPQLPALLPEVWLHWDPRTVTDRGCDALLRFRMDFLLLLPQGIRVVIEVDGKQHYADANGFADVQRYAQITSADRDLERISK